VNDDSETGLVATATGSATAFRSNAEEDFASSLNDSRSIATEVNCVPLFVRTT